MEWDKGHRSEHGQKGWVALRDLGSKFGSPSTLGSLASYCKAKGRGSPMGGEVTGMGGVGLLEPAPPTSPPPLVCTLTLEALRGESPRWLQARHPGAASRQKGKANKTEREGGRRGR